LNNHQLEFSIKDFPQPFLPATLSLPSLDLIKDDSPLVLQYTCNLSGLIGIVTDQSMLPQNDTQPTGLGNVVDYYLSAHGYTADAQHVIVCGFKLNNTLDGFSGFLSGRGMAKSEAVWLWHFIDYHTN
jgi:hypothetical protein